MNKTEFLERIKVKISHLPYGEMRRHLDYYDEMLDDLVEEGLGEEEAVATLESPEVIAEQILEEASPLKAAPDPVVEGDTAPQKSYRYRLGFLPLVILLLLVTICMHIVAVCFICCAVGFTVVCVWAAVKEGLNPALVMGGSALITLGLFFFLLPACRALRRAFGRSMRWACGNNSKEVPEK